MRSDGGGVCATIERVYAQRWRRCMHSGGVCAARPIVEKVEERLIVEEAEERSIVDEAEELKSDDETKER